MHVKRELLQLVQDFYKDPSNRKEFKKWKQEQAHDNHEAAYSTNRSQMTSEGIIPCKS